MPPQALWQKLAFHTQTDGLIPVYPWKHLFCRGKNLVELSNIKAVADNNSNMVKMKTFAFDRVENIVGKGENAGNQHFLLFPQCFQKPTFSGS